MILALVVFYFFSNRFIAEEALRLWEVDTVTNTQLSGNYDAGIVLGGGLVAIDQKTQHLVYGQSADRILQAIEMYKKGRIQKIMISGGAGELFDPHQVESLLMRKFLLNIGIPAEDILVDSLSRNTHENSVETKKILDEEIPNGKFLLFTSAVHMRRASASFKMQGINVDLYSTNQTIRLRNFSFENILLPSSMAVYYWETMLHEINGFIVYKIMGYA